jgi:hypothetical protein
MPAASTGLGINVVNRPTKVSRAPQTSFTNHHEPHEHTQTQTNHIIYRRYTLLTTNTQNILPSSTIVILLTLRLIPLYNTQSTIPTNKEYIKLSSNSYLYHYTPHPR